MNKLLLDTHIFLWSILEPEKLAGPVVRELMNPSNEIWLSPISIWETAILAEKGRLTLDDEPVSWIQKALEVLPFKEAALNHAIALQSRTIGLPHQDPADRFIAATALVYGLTLVTADKHLIQSSHSHSHSYAILPNVER